MIRRFRFSIVALAAVVLAGCATSTPSDGEEDDPASQDEQTDSDPLSPTQKLTDKVDGILEAYLRGKGVKKALDGWLADLEDADHEEAARSFRRAARNRGAREFEVPAMILEVGVPRRESSGRKTGILMQAVVFPDKSQPTLAGIRIQSALSGTIGHGDLPKNAPLLKRLALGLFPAVTETKKCKSLPVADVETIRERLPPGPRTDRLVKIHDGAADRLDKFCEAIPDDAGPTSPELRISPFIGLAKNENGLRVGHLELRVAPDKSGELRIHRWPTRLRGGDDAESRPSGTPPAPESR